MTAATTQATPPRKRHCAICAKDYDADDLAASPWEGYCPECKAKSDKMRERVDAILAERRAQ